MSQTVDGFRPPCYRQIGMGGVHQLEGRTAGNDVSIFITEGKGNISLEAEIEIDRLMGVLKDVRPVEPLNLEAYLASKPPVKRERERNEILPLFWDTYAQEVFLAKIKEADLPALPVSDVGKIRPRKGKKGGMSYQIYFKWLKNGVKTQISFGTDHNLRDAERSAKMMIKMINNQIVVNKLG